MTSVMNPLYEYVLEHILEQYYHETAYYEYRAKRDAVGRELWEQLPANQRRLLEELQRAYDRAELCELEAMFLAAFDECCSLMQRHISPGAKSVHPA